MPKTLPGMKGVTIPSEGFFYHDPTHRYFMDGERMTGVTTIVDGVGDKSNLIQWASNQAAAVGIMEAATWLRMRTEGEAERLWVTRG